MTGQVAVELLLVPQCPHADTARTLLMQCLEESGLDVAVVERVGEFPSPTILVDGQDVTTGREVTPGVSSCRLDVPTVPQVLHALRKAARTAPASGSGQIAVPSSTVEEYPAELAVGVTRDRIAVVSPASRALHQVILRRFATTGTAPDTASLADAVPDDGDLDNLLAELHVHDVIRLDAQGAVRAAYPFSGVRTAHVVAIDGGPSVYAMCAIDALGIAEMLGRDVTIASTDPSSNAEIRVSVRKGQTVFSPETAVVFVGSKDSSAAIGDCCPPEGAGQPRTVAAADRCCGVMNFFAGPDSANRWLAAHPEVSGVILTQGQALRLGVDIFGRLLDD